MLSSGFQGIFFAAVFFLEDVPWGLILRLAWYSLILYGVTAVMVIATMLGLRLAPRMKRLRNLLREHRSNHE